jgi:hypothetical protein
MSAIIDEIVSLIRNNIHLNKDSFNLCKFGDTIHLHFNDLGSMSINEISDEDILYYIEDYVSWMISAIVNSVSDNVYENSPYIKAMSSQSHTLRVKLKEIVGQKLQQEVDS